jgi:hypothetical protein
MITMKIVVFFYVTSCTFLCRQKHLEKLAVSIFMMQIKGSRYIRNTVKNNYKASLSDE